MNEMRRIIGIVESAETILYHVTPVRNLRAIMQNGLIPKRGVRSRQLGEPVPAIYFFPSLEDVADALDGWLGNQFAEDARLALLAVTMHPGAEIQTGAGYERISSNPIPPDHIRVLSRDVMGETDVAGLGHVRASENRPVDGRMKPD